MFEWIFGYLFGGSLLSAYAIEGLLQLLNIRRQHGCLGCRERLADVPQDSSVYVFNPVDDTVLVQYLQSNLMCDVLVSYN